MYKLTLANGREYSAEWCSVTEETLTIQIIEAAEDGIAAIVDVFSDADLTETISVDYGVKTVSYAGYTRLIMIHDQRCYGKNVIIQLLREDGRNG